MIWDVGFIDIDQLSLYYFYTILQKYIIISSDFYEVLSIIFLI
jgi:hypothetical protein